MELPLFCIMDHCDLSYVHHYLEYESCTYGHIGSRQTCKNAKLELFLHCYRRQL